MACAGRGSYGELGYENTLNVGDGPGEMPPPDVNMGGQASQLTAATSSLVRSCRGDQGERCVGVIIIFCERWGGERRLSD